MNTLLSFWRSTIGKKVVMGVTGLIGLGFVVGHMAGNLQAFSGEEKIDAYGALLHGPLHELLLLARVVLIAAVVLHITAAYQLTMLSRAARPLDYANRKPQVSTLASKTLRWGGTWSPSWGMPRSVRAAGPCGKTGPCASLCLPSLRSWPPPSPAPPAATRRASATTTPTAAPIASAPSAAAARNATTTPTAAPTASVASAHAMASLTSGLKRGEAAAGFASAVRQCADVLASNFPVRTGDNPNELSDAVVVLPST